MQPNQNLTDYLVSLGRVSGQSAVHKFGSNPDVDTDSTPEDVWTQGGLYTFLAAGAPLFISSSNAGDTQDIEVQGLDDSWNMQTITQTMAGQTKTAIGSSGEKFIRVFRAVNVNAADNAGTIYIYEDDTVTNEVPDTASKIKANIIPGANQTLMAIYSIPVGYHGFISDIFLNANRGTGTQDSAFDVSVRVRPFGGVFQTKLRLSYHSEGGIIEKAYKYPELIQAKSDVLVRVDNANVNGIDVNAGFDLLLVKS